MTTELALATRPAPPQCGAFHPDKLTNTVTAAAAAIRTAIPAARSLYRCMVWREVPRGCVTFPVNSGQQLVSHKGGQGRRGDNHDLLAGWLSPERPAPAMKLDRDSAGLSENTILWYYRSIG